MTTIYSTENTITAAARLVLTPREAAQALAVSERTLWALTAPRGPLAVVRIGRSVRYALEDLHAFIGARTQRRPAAANGEPL